MYYVYILTNKTNRVLYVGITNNLVRRVYEHRNKAVDGFTKKYNVDKLVYYDDARNVRDAIAREKQIKGWVRRKKIALINEFNPSWRDLYYKIIQ